MHLIFIQRRGKKHKDESFRFTINNISYYIFIHCDKFLKYSENIFIAQADEMSRKLEIRQIELRQAADRAAAAQSRLDSVNEKLKNMDRKVKYKYKKKFSILSPSSHKGFKKMAFNFQKITIG